MRAASPAVVRSLNAAITIVAILLFAALCLPESYIYNSSVSDRSSRDALPVMIPFEGSEIETDDHLHSFSFDLSTAGFLSLRYRFGLVGCLRSLTVNGAGIILSGYSSTALCDRRNGIIVDLAPFMQSRKNISVQAVVEAEPRYQYLEVSPYSRLVINERPGHYGLSVSPYYAWLDTGYFFPVIVLALVSLAAARLVIDPQLRRRRFAIGLAMAAVACLVRLPFFFDSTRGPYTLDFTFWDEATYLNMGRYVLEGHLPYLHLWENKPPLLFYLYGLTGFLAGFDLAWTRLLGSLVIATTGFVVCLTGKRLLNAQAGWIAGVAYIVYVSAGIPSQSLLTDHFATLPFALAFLYALKAENRLRHSVLIGILLGISAVTMNNYLMAAPFIALLVWLKLNRQPLVRRILHAGLIGLCSLLPFGLFVAIYAGFHRFDALWGGAVLSALGQIGSTAAGHMMLAQKLDLFGIQWMSNAFGPRGPVFWAGAAGLAFCFVPQSGIARRDAIGLALLALSVMLFTAYRLKMAPNPVYTAGMILPDALVTGVVLARLGSDTFFSRRGIAVAAASAAALCVALLPLTPAYGEMFQKLAQKRVLKDDTLYQVAAIINRSPLEHPYIFACKREQILYYLTGSSLPEVIAHPDNLNEQYIREVYLKDIRLSDIYDEIKSHHPAYIIGPAGDPCYQELGDAMRNYRLIYSYDNLQLWRLIQAEHS